MTFEVFMGLYINEVSRKRGFGVESTINEDAVSDAEPRDDEGQIFVKARRIDVSRVVSQKRQRQATIDEFLPKKIALMPSVDGPKSSVQLPAQISDPDGMTELVVSKAVESSSDSK